MLYNLPIEPLEERYSIQWAGWFEEAFMQEDLAFKSIVGESLGDKIEVGSFLDVFSTNHWKCSQLNNLIPELYNVKDEDVFFFHDIWSPAVINLKYMLDGAGSKAKIYGCIHAGSYDPYDFLALQGMNPWARHFEQSILNCCEKIFVATHFHKGMIEKSFSTFDQIRVTGFPIKGPSEKIDYKAKENIVVFPHRLQKEKNPDQFDTEMLSKKFPDWKFIRSKECCETKEEYFNLLKKSKIAVSFANQETWGIAMQEAVFRGCVPIVPSRLSYREMYPSHNWFDGKLNFLSVLNRIINNYEIYREANEDTQEHLSISGLRAINKMIGNMYE